MSELSLYFSYRCTKENPYLYFNFNNKYYKYKLPSWILKSYKEKVLAPHKQTWCDYPAIEYGFSIYEDLFLIYHGVNGIEDKLNNKIFIKIPWLAQRFVGKTFFDTNHNVLCINPTANGSLDEKLLSVLPKEVIVFNDYDGEEIEATCNIIEYRWERGVSWCKWLSLITKPNVCRNIDISFNKEVGKKKGSWKGGIVGTGFEIKPNEPIISAFKRYAEKNGLTNVRLKGIGEQLLNVEDSLENIIKKYTKGYQEYDFVYDKITNHGYIFNIGRSDDPYWTLYKDGKLKHCNIPSFNRLFNLETVPGNDYNCSENT